LQSTFCAQRCWNCIGVACRIAQGLGLHVDQSPAQKSSLGQEMRRRVWYACMMLDVYVSFRFVHARFFQSHFLLLERR
jgi:hypothetical protein